MHNYYPHCSTLLQNCNPHGVEKDERMRIMTLSQPKKLLALLFAAVLLWFALRYLLPISLPFLLAAALALAAEPLVFFFHQRLKLPRGAASGIGVTVTLVIVVLLLTTLLTLLLRQLQSLTGVLPDLAQAVSQGIQSLREWLLSLVEKVPGGIRPMVTRSVEGLFEDGSDLISGLLTRLLGVATELVSRLPDSALSIGTWLLASYMLSAKLPRLRLWAENRISQQWREQYFPMLGRLKKAVFGWLSAQLKLMSITFGLLLAGFWLLDVAYGPVWAALIALMDALPILGAAVALVPWSVVCFLQGQTVRAVGLLGLCAGAVLLRSILEPKLVGKQLGLDPLITLAAMYAGYRLWGFPGLILAPILAVAVRQLFAQQNVE